MKCALFFHRQASIVNDRISEEYFHEWLEGLGDNIKKEMKNNGFEAYKIVLLLTRYVNERCDIGMDEWLKNHLSEDDFNYWLDAGKTKS